MSMLKKWVSTSVAVFFLVFSVGSHAQNTQGQYNPILNIVPSSTSTISVSTTTTRQIIYTVTNGSSSLPVSEITVPNPYYIGPNNNISTNLLHLAVTNNGCTGTLNPAGHSGDSCTFTLEATGGGQSGTASLRPQLCIFNNAACSVPAATNEVPVNILAASVIKVTEPSLMFVNTNFGGNFSLYQGVLTVTNVGSSSVFGLSTTVQNNTGNTITNSSTTCPSPLTVGSSCTFTYTSAVPVDTGASILISDINGNSVTTPVAAISVVALAPPTDSSVGMTLVAGCVDTQDDAGVFEITNNSSSTVSNIQAGVSGGLNGVTINNPTNTSSNVYCNGASLAQNQYCQIQIAPNTVASGATGSITFSGSGTQNVEIQAKVESPGASLPATGADGDGNYVFISNPDCNLAEIVSGTSDTVNNVNWTAANSYCSSYSTGGSDWRLIDIGQAPGNPASSTQINGNGGEFSVLYSNGTPKAGMSTSHGYWGPYINSTTAWSPSFISGTQAEESISTTSAVLYVRCARAFTN
jgi:hypothetical protein